MKNKNTKQYKAVNYCYPTSPMASKLGVGKSGCFYVTIENSTAHRISVHRRIFESKAEAFTYADTIPLPLSRYSFNRG